MLTRYSAWKRKKTKYFPLLYFHNLSDSDTKVFGYVDVKYPKERSPDCRSSLLIDNSLYCFDETRSICKCC
jgi:hypothetical protein